MSLSMTWSIVGNYLYRRWHRVLAATADLNTILILLSSLSAQLRFRFERAYCHCGLSSCRGCRWETIDLHPKCSHLFMQFLVLSHREDSVRIWHIYCRYTPNWWLQCLIVTGLEPWTQFLSSHFPSPSSSALSCLASSNSVYGLCPLR